MLYPAIARYLILFSPVLLIVSQSYFRVELIGFLDMINTHQSSNLYYALRLALICLFGLLLATVSVSGVATKVVIDVYGAERSVRDPLLGLRGLACLNVFFGHWFLVVAAPSQPAHDTWGYLSRAALSFSPWCGVWIFFTLSGYLIVKGFVSGRHALDNQGIRKYYKNRAIRIIPVYFGAIALVALTIHPQALNIFDAKSREQMLAAIFFDQPGSGLISALWSVSTEFQFYLAAPLITIILVAALRTLPAMLAFTLAQVCLFGALKYLIMRWHPEFWHAHVYLPLLSNLDCFLGGAVTAMAVHNLRAANFYLRAGMASGIILTLLAQGIFSFWSYPEMISFPGHPGSSTLIYYLSFAPGVTALLTCSIIFLFELSVRSQGKGGLAWKLSTFFGTITYCLYTAHEPIILAIRPFLASEISFRYSFAAMPVAFVLCVAGALVLYRGIEIPFDRFRFRPKSVL